MAAQWVAHNKADTFEGLSSGRNRLQNDLGNSNRSVNVVPNDDFDVQGSSCLDEDHIAVARSWLDERKRGYPVNNRKCRQVRAST
eukprot:2361614-Rhodomonas_salina.1